MWRAFIDERVEILTQFWLREFYEGRLNGRAFGKHWRTPFLNIFPHILQVHVPQSRQEWDAVVTRRAAQQQLGAHSVIAVLGNFYVVTLWTSGDFPFVDLSPSVPPTEHPLRTMK